MNHITTVCGRPVNAVGAPGSKARKEYEKRPCDKCLAEQQRRKEMDAKQQERNVQAAQIEYAIALLELVEDKFAAVGINESAEYAYRTNSLKNDATQLAKRLKGAL